MRTAALLFVVLVLGAAARVHADDIEPPPAACPFGTVAEADHSGPHCERLPACNPGACPAAMTCAERSFCVREVDCGGLRPHEDRCLREHVVGTCDEGRSCPEGARCIAHPTCVFPPAAPSTGAAPSVASPAAAPSAEPAAEPAGGCSVGMRAPSFVLALPALLLLLVASRRR